ncbi:E4 SUMO-protein ligase PIAL2-like isoform X2 [Tripterygium wilfordii]|nr:E4 SUMO-protein ligase PIAL2-like isoform X2 [Tripterygium wilfordii]XP_038682205.1 E4 SUMO-protein ligase PIAL2-like isoform X2 [Tripterygium wilfordii]
MLQYGTNLLQAVGQFNGHFIIVLAFMSNSSLPEAPVLEDYVLSGTPMTDSENDIIEGPSRISLMCPIRYALILVSTSVLIFFSYKCNAALFVILMLLHALGDKGLLVILV